MSHLPTQQTYTDNIMRASTALQTITDSHLSGEMPWTAEKTNRSVKVSVVIPALNEAENLPYVLPKIPTWVHEVLLVDGNSTDNTIEVAQQLRSDIRIVMQEGRGKGAALRSGIAAATGDIVVMLDADGSTDPAEIPIFVGALLTGADFAKGSRFLQGGGTVDMPLYRRIGNEALVILTNLLFRTRYTDITYGYNAVWRSLADCMALEINGWACEIVSNIRVARNNLRIVEVASFEHERIAGEAKLRTFSAGWVILKAILREFFSKMAEPKHQPMLRQVIHLEAYLGLHTLQTDEMHFMFAGLTGQGYLNTSVDPSAEIVRERAVGE